MSNQSPNPQDLKKEKNEELTSYEVGYKKPPVSTRFQKGQSGNKKGRPKGSKNRSMDLSSNYLNELIIKECMHEITIHEGDKSQKVTKIEAMTKSLLLKGIKGDLRSQKLLFALFSEADKNNTDIKQQYFEAALLRKKYGLQKIAYAKEKEKPEPDLVPHPNHIKVYPRTGKVEIIGPLSEDEKKDWDLAVARKLELRETLYEIKQRLEADNDPNEKEHLSAETRKDMMEEIESLEHLINKIRQRIPDDIYLPPSTIEFCNSDPDLSFPE